VPGQEPGVEVPVSLVSPPPVLPESPSGLVGVSVGLSLVVSVGVSVGVGVAVGVGVSVGVGDVALAVGVTDELGAPPDVLGVGVADGLAVAHDGDGDGDGMGDGRTACVMLRAISSALRSLAEVGVVATFGSGNGEAATELVTTVVTLAPQVEDVVGCGVAVPLDELAPAPRLAPSAPVAVAVAPAGPVPLPVCEPLPSVPAPPPGCDGPACRTVVLAAMIACRNGCTPNETLAMTATAASSTATGRSQLTSSRRAVPAVRAERAWPGRSGSPGPGSSRSRGNGSRGTRASALAAGAGSAAVQAGFQCQDQDQRQTQCLAAPRVSAAKLSSHGRGGRPPILARIRSSPSVPGSIRPRASVRLRRSASSMPPSGVVMPSPARLRRPRHEDSWDSIVFSDAIARAV
jgi:hypothetical protein